MEWLEEDNWFFRLSAYRELLLEHFDAHPDWVVPAPRYNEARRMIEAGLEDLSISRSQISWGVPVPWDPEQVIYVWVDALFNYWTALCYGAGPDGVRFWPPDLQLMAKDILKFHAVIWPALLMAAGIALPRRLAIHGYVLKGGEKMSKTTGNLVDPFPFIEDYGIDALRYYLSREIRFGEDGTFSAEGFDARYTGELANELGNLLNRTVSMIDRYRDGVVPADQGLDGELATAVAAQQAEVVAAFDEHRHHAGRRGGLGAGAGAQPPGRAARTLGARQGSGLRFPARPGAVLPRGRPQGGRGPAVAGHPGECRTGAGVARAGPGARSGSTRPPGARGSPGPA